MRKFWCLFFFIVVVLLATPIVERSFSIAFPILSTTSQEEPPRKPLPMRILLTHSFGLTVPDTNTARSAFGGRLRVYDIHIAKMFEVTQWACTSTGKPPNPDYWSWFYLADEGRIGMGVFKISCQLASDIAFAYGLGEGETTEMKIVDLGSARKGDSTTSIKSFEIPQLKITGGKVDKWLAFVQSFKPFAALSPKHSPEPLRAPTTDGSCECPYDTDKRGRSCGGRSAYSKANGRSGARCYSTD